MAMTITKECIACGVCETECPRNCIETGDIYVIDKSKCTECKDEGGPKCIEVCPVDCIEKLP